MEQQTKDLSPTLELVHAQVLAQPDTPAIFETDGSVISFGELWERSVDLAERLDIECGEITGFCLPRSADVVVAMMAVLMRCGVYAPFSPDDPPERTENLQNRLGVRRVIRSDGQQTVVHSREVGAAPIMDMSGDPAERPIYVMWTSGSTGEPKAVVVPHRGVVRLIRDRDFMDIGPSDRMVFASNAMFDAATWEIWASLANGAGLVVISPADLVDARRLRARFEQTGVTRTFLTTSLFNHLVRSFPPCSCSMSVSRSLIVASWTAERWSKPHAIDGAHLSHEPVISNRNSGWPARSNSSLISVMWGSTTISGTSVSTRSAQLNSVQQFPTPDSAR